MSEIFEYNDKYSYESNYSRWRLMNNEEKKLFREKPYPEPIAKRKFGELYGDKRLKEKLKELVRGLKP